MKTECDKMLAGELYDAFDSDLVAARRPGRAGDPVRTRT
jgi:hypothetical protein